MSVFLHLHIEFLQPELKAYLFHVHKCVLYPNLPHISSVLLFLIGLNPNHSLVESGPYTKIICPYQACHGIISSL